MDERRNIGGGADSEMNMFWGAFFECREQRYRKDHCPPLKGDNMTVAALSAGASAGSKLHAPTSACRVSGKVMPAIHICFCRETGCVLSTRFVDTQDNG